MKKLSYKAFTLVEMLIVIVIIGILAAALIPKLQGMQGRARDTARKADLGQIGTAFTVFYADNGRYPGTTSTTNSSGGNVNDLSSALVPAIMSSIPKDPNATRYFGGIVAGIGATGTAENSALGSYRFTTLYRNGREGHAFALMAGTEEAGSSSNYIFTTGSISPTTNLNTLCDFDYAKKYVCPSISRPLGATTNVTGCIANPDHDIIRYAYIN